MTLTFPYGLDFLANCLIGETIPLGLRRFDEMSGSGDGRFWSTQLATPLWGASYALTGHDANKARELNGKINALDGMSKPFLWADPYYKGPASGVTDGLDNVTVSAIRADRGAVSLRGLPPGFRLSAGDYISIGYTSGRVYFGQFAEGANATDEGTVTNREIRPYLPFGVGTGSPVEMIRPRFRAVVTDFTPFAITRGQVGSGASITILQKP